MNPSAEDSGGEPTRRPVALIVMASTMTSEPRVRRESRTLSLLGFDVRALGIRLRGDEPRAEFLDSLHVHRVELPDIAFLRWWRGRRTTGRSDPNPLPSGGLTTSGIDVIGDARNLVHWCSSTVVFSWNLLYERADVLIPHDLPPAVAAMVVGRLRSIPIVYESHECWAEKFPSRPISRIVARWIERLVCQRSVAVIVVNDSIAERMAHDYRIQLPTAIWNTPDVHPIEKLDPAPPRLRLLYHGAIEPGRGVEHAVRAVALMTEEAELVVRGTGTLEGAIRQLTIDLQIEHRVTVESPVDIGDIVQQASAFQVGVVSLEPRMGYEYALPNKLFEYLAAGLAVVATDLPEMRRILVHYDVGEVVAFSDDGFSISLASTLDRIARDRTRLELMRANALLVSAQHFTWSTHQNMLRQVFSNCDLLGPSGSLAK